MAALKIVLSELQQQQLWKKTSSNFIKSLIALESRHVFTISSLYLSCLNMTWYNKHNHE